MTTAECVTVLRGIPKKLPNAIRRGMRRGMVQAGVDAQRFAAQRGIMRGLLGDGGMGPVDGSRWKSPGKGLIRVKSPRIMRDGSVWSGLEAVGLAAMQELGGKIRPHDIKVHAGKKALLLRTFVIPFARSVKHPGGRVTRYPFLEDAIKRNQPNILREIEKALAEDAAKIEAAAA